MSQKARTVGLFAFALLLAVSHGAARAQVVKPFQISGGGPAPDGISLIPNTAVVHYATGQATELGRYSCEGMFQLLGFNSATVATFSSAPFCVFTAANGDVLTCTYGVVANGAAGPGVVTLTQVSPTSYTARFVAEFNPVPAMCTGRFANLISGSFIMVAQSTPFSFEGDHTSAFNYTWEGNGSLEFGKGR
jgi:hypothetical protein